MSEKNYTCSDCGGMMEFDVATQSLKCPNCGKSITIINDRSRVVEHPLTRAGERKISVSQKTSHTMECKSCGAKIEVEANCTATLCPYCGTPYVLAEKQEDVVVPDGVMPFRIDRNEVGKIFSEWIRRRWLAPGQLKSVYQKGKLQGIYLPYWTFDAQADCYYTAMGGRIRTETIRDRDGQTHTKTHTDWYPTSGRVHRFFDDILVRASEKLDAHLLGRIEPFDTENVSSWAPEYLSGYQAECCSRDLSDAHGEAVQKMNAELMKLAEQDVLRVFDTVRDVRIRPDFQHETYKHVILPIYATAYEYQGKQYTVLINGQTGKIKGGYPKSVAKILLIAAAAAAVFLLAYHFLFGEDAQYAEQNIRYETEYAQETETGCDTVPEVASGSFVSVSENGRMKTEQQEVRIITSAENPVWI